MRCRLRAGVYPVAAAVQRRAAAGGHRVAQACPLCAAVEETGRHAVLQCPATVHIRGDVSNAVMAACGARGRQRLKSVAEASDAAAWQAVLWRLCLGGRVQSALVAAPARGLSRRDRLAVYAATARVLRAVLRARVQLIATAHQPAAADLAAWSQYPEFATRL